MLFAVAGLEIASDNFGLFAPYQTIAIGLSDQVFLMIDAPEQYIAAHAGEEN